MIATGGSGNPWSSAEPRTIHLCEILRYRRTERILIEYGDPYAPTKVTSEEFIGFPYRTALSTKAIFIAPIVLYSNHYT